MQLKTSDSWYFLKQAEINAGINYRASANYDIGIGGTYTTTRESYVSHLDESDHRLFAQLVIKEGIFSATATHRFRLEQRFIETTNNSRFFAQRVRYRFRVQLPLQHQIDKFTRGFYVSAQNEIFLNTLNKNKLNTHLFDQNRAMAAIGYKISTLLDIEGGYLNSFSAGKTINKCTHIFQFSLNTRL